MDSSSRPCSTASARSGGKMARRRTSVRKTPYDRPPPRSARPSRSPNWLTGLIFPASRKLATGAGKLLASVFTGASSSSSSSSSSDSASGSEDNINDAPSDRVNGFDEISSGMLESTGKEHVVTPGKTENKCVIERMIMQETFSREESDVLIKMISSRVVDYSTLTEGLDRRLCETPTKPDGNDTADLCNKAIMEAKSWIEEKKSFSSSKSLADRQTFIYNAFLLPQGTDGSGRSPVDVAKSYMQARSPWASPSIKHIGARSSSPMAVDLFKEETPKSVGGSSFSSSKKRDSFATGSWNLREEIRRLRFKATEDLLILCSSKKDPQSYISELKTTPFLSMADKAVGMGDEMHEPNSSMETKQVLPSENLAIGVDTCRELPDPGACYGDSSTAKEATKVAGTSNLSSCAGLDTKQSPKQSDGENPNPVSPSHGKLTHHSIPVEENCGLLIESSIEVPIVNETSSPASGSQNSSSIRQEAASQKHAAAKPKCGVAEKPTRPAARKPLLRKPGRYSRGRGRGGKGIR